MEHTTMEKWSAEFLGTFLLVFGGAGTAIFAAQHVGFLGVALAFGLTVLVGVYAFGPVSGGHFNPAVTVGLAVAGRFSWKDVPGYVIVQVVAGVIAGAALYVIAIGRDGFDATNNFAANGYGEFSPDGYALGSVIVAEVLLTLIFLLVILGSTAKRASAGFAGIAIGLSLTLIHLISIPISNTSVNPARSIGTAIFAGGDQIVQLWVFLLAPVLGAVIAGVIYPRLMCERD